MKEKLQRLAQKFCSVKREKKKLSKVHSSQLRSKVKIKKFLHVWLKWAELKYNLQLNLKKAYFIRKNASIVIAAAVAVEWIWFNWNLAFFIIKFYFCLPKQLRELQYFFFAFFFIIWVKNYNLDVFESLSYYRNNSSRFMRAH